MNITLYSLSDYNGGVLIAKTFDLNLIDTYQDYEKFGQDLFINDFIMLDGGHVISCH